MYINIYVSVDINLNVFIYLALHILAYLYPSCGIVSMLVSSIIEDA